MNAGVNPSNIARAVEIITDEVRRFSTQPVELEELRDNQANFIGGMPLRLESNEGVSAALLHIEHYDLGLDYYQRYPQKIAEITPQKVLEVAKEFLDPDRLVIGIAGPKTEEV